MHLAVATDSAYVPWCATAVLSCLQVTSERPFHVHVLHSGDLSPADQSRLRGMVHNERGEIDFFPIDESRVAHLPSKGATLGGRVSWLRVLLPELLPETDRVIYLDADTLSMSSVQELWSTRLGDAPVAAVPNVVHPSMRSHVEELGISGLRGYFNAGVLVMNLALMRDERTSDDIAAAVRRLGETCWYDQDVLNVVFSGRWIALDARWNTQNSFWNWSTLAREVFAAQELQRAITAPTILHFEGPGMVKPWHYLCQHPFRSSYREVLSRTPWGDMGLEERTFATRAIRLLPGSARLGAYTRWHQLKDRLRTRALAS